MKMTKLIHRSSKIDKLSLMKTACNTRSRNSKRQFKTKVLCLTFPSQSTRAKMEKSALKCPISELYLIVCKTPKLKDTFI